MKMLIIKMGRDWFNEIKPLNNIIMVILSTDEEVDNKNGILNKCMMKMLNRLNFV